MQNIVHRGPHVWTTPIEVRLFLEEGMIIILGSDGVVFPCAAAEIAQPVVRRPTIRSRIVPEVPVTAGIVARRTALDEPRMLLGSMVRYEVQDHLETPRMSLSQQTIEVAQGSENRGDAKVVTDVVSAIRHG